MEAFLALLPFALLLLVCPLMMLFMHRGGHGDRQQHPTDDRAELVRRSQASKDDTHS